MEVLRNALKEPTVDAGPKIRLVGRGPNLRVDCAPFPNELDGPAVRERVPFERGADVVVTGLLNNDRQRVSYRYVELEAVLKVGPLNDVPGRRDRLVR